MKDYRLGVINCKCSARMHCRGELFRVYKCTSAIRACPNCGKQCRVFYATKTSKEKGIEKQHSGLVGKIKRMFSRGKQDVVTN